VKSTFSRIILSFFILALLISNSSSTELKTFIKDYTYQASDFDSKMSSRTIALEQVKRLLLEEVGTYLTSETDVKDFQLTRDKITTLSAGVVQTEILEEKWDGKTYYLKVKVSLDPQEVTKLLAGLRDNKQKNRELEETNRKVNEALKRIKELQDERGQGSVNKQNEYSRAVAELKAKEWIDKGLAFMNAENYESALNAFNNAVEIDPTSSWAHINKGWALNTLGDYYQALKEFNRASDIDPKNLWIYVNRGMSYNSLGDYRQGFIDAEKAISLDANISMAYIGRGWAYIGLGNFNQAIADLNKAEQLDPKNPFAYSTRAWAHNAQGSTHQAAKDLERSINLAPNNSWMLWNRAVYYALSGEKGKSIADLEKAVRINGNLKQRAKTDKNFQSLWNDVDFMKLVDR
jgi:tetratricopeptide (TPR) repeat protein